METHTERPAAAPPTRAVEVGKLERELAAMWLPANGEGKPAEAGTSSDHGITRACVLNLIVYATPHEDAKAIDALLDEVAQQHPSRVLLLLADEKANAPRLEAYVSARCQVGEGGGAAKQVCGEQVTIEAGGKSLETVGSAVEPLLVPDVPVFLWWKDIPHYEDKLFNRLVEMSDRVVLDSLAFDHPHEDLLRLAQIIRSHPQFMLVSDLNWGRLTSWRMLIASFWDVPDYRPRLDQIERVVVEYDPPDVAQQEIAAQGLLIVGWLVSGLGWEIVSTECQRDAEVCRFLLRAADDRRIVVELRPLAERKERDGLIASLTLHAGDAEFYVAVNEAGDKLETSASIGAQHTVGRVLAYEAKTEGQRLSRELGWLTRDAVYERAVLAAAQLLEAARQ